MVVTDEGSHPFSEQPVVKPRSTAQRSTGILHALSSAALMLPGIISPAAQAQDASIENFSFQFDRFQEGDRDLIDVRSGLDPISVDVVHGALNAIIAGGLNLHLNYSQDSWSGATPFTTAPLAANGNRPILRNSASGLIQSGASPYANNRVLLDANRQPYISHADSSPTADSRVVHILSSASPEIRQQGDVTLSYEWQDSALEFGTGVSDEPDFYSRFASAAMRFDFRQKTTNLKMGAAFTDNDIHAILDSDVLPYLTKGAYANEIERRDGEDILKTSSHEWTWHAGLTQVLDRRSLVDFSVGWTKSSGYLSSPYKASTVIFVDPALQSNNPQSLVAGDMQVLMEQRPDERRQLAFSTRYIQYVDSLDAAWHLNYQYSSDSWDMSAHTFVAQWVQPIANTWTVTPRLRYYSQQESTFYTPYIVSEQAYRTISFADGEAIIKSFDPALLPRYFSSDHRLSGFGAISASLTLSKEITRGLSFEASVESYRRASSLQFGGDGTGDYSDMEFTMLSAGVKLDFLGARSRAARQQRMQMPEPDAHAGHTGMAMDTDTHKHPLSAGLMFAHMLPVAGDVMMSYRVQTMSQSGQMLDEDGRVSDAQVVAQGCLAEQCRYAPSEMNMQMHMLDLMYAPKDWLTLMVMPQLMSMDMSFRDLDGRPLPSPGEHEHAGSGGHHSGGFGDTVVAAVARLPQGGLSNWHAGLGLSIPTGKVDLELRRMFKIDGGLMHFDMQTGSGTWDLLPSVTYSAMKDQWSFGAQWSSIHRMGAKNSSGYRLGDQQQLSTWLGYTVTPALSFTTRGTYTYREEVEGDFNAYNARLGPMDYPYNQGGRLLEAGLGASYTIPSTTLAGSQFNVEWVVPLHEAPFGVQLEREPSLNASWTYHF